MSVYELQINGTANAWPVFLGEDHPFYNRKDPADLANASFSLIGREGDGRITPEILIDAGHGVVQQLLAGDNRLPGAVVLTHPHLDHTASLDWIARSYFEENRKEKKLPVFCSMGCYSSVIKAFPQLKETTEHQEIFPGIRRNLTPDSRVRITGFPVYHGQSAMGAMMVVLQAGDAGKVIFTGDILFPLLREEDYALLRDAAYLVTDTNNLLPYPRSNHWSLVSTAGARDGESVRLREFRSALQTGEILRPHRHEPFGREWKDWFAAIEQQFDSRELPLSIFDFVKKIRPAKVLCVHYSGGEDENHNGMKRLTRRELADWIAETAAGQHIPASFEVPAAGNVYPLP